MPLPPRPWLVAATVVGLLLLFSFLQVLAAIHPPHRVRSPQNINPQATLDIPYEDVTLTTSDGISLAAWFLPASPNTTDHATLVVGHGYPFDKGNVLAAVAFLHEAGFNLILYDHRGHGQSDGRISTLGLHEPKDVHAALAHLEQRPDIDPDRIGGLGFSLSAAAMLQALPDAPSMRCLVADSSFASLDELRDDVLRFLPGPLKWPITVPMNGWAWLFLGATPSEVNPADALARVPADVPVLLHHDADDGEIPVRHLHLLAEHIPPGANVTTWQTEGMGHGGALAAGDDTYRARIIAFFEACLGPEGLT